MDALTSSKGSYRAAFAIFTASATIIMAAGLFSSKSSNAAEPEKAASAKTEPARSFSLKKWQLLAK